MHDKYKFIATEESKTNIIRIFLPSFYHQLTTKVQGCPHIPHFLRIAMAEDVNVISSERLITLSLLSNCVYVPVA